MVYDQKSLNTGSAFNRLMRCCSGPAILHKKGDDSEIGRVSLGTPVRLGHRVVASLVAWGELLLGLVLVAECLLLDFRRWRPYSVIAGASWVA